eukprot:gnl/MRDRNA2_/MRDRNA2_80784_c0_seq1.p1 gnl/MRDRNA2_/MRDRNA2_80784_c0~~gnl/MRDRNA2_/MRDRNA2_80784_c0_seq1.p1  ORF type:complete len:311 (+),score=31.87 gnl/MRDRNA2_/MRDRNA2_80784_c0_seq1:80-1012(+)
MLKLIVFAALCDIAWSLKLQTNEEDPAKLKESKDDAKAHIFFINLEEDTDRRHCVTAQLQEAPYPVTRIPAATPVKMKRDCAALFRKTGYRRVKDILTNGKYKDPDEPNDVQAALYCSNYLTWKHFYEKTEAEYALIMEDDIILTPDFWPKLNGLLQASLDGKCGHNWDYITVDPWHGDAASTKGLKQIGHSTTCRKDLLHSYNLEDLVATKRTQLQIVRRRAIWYLLNHAEKSGAQVLDLWHKAYPHWQISMSRWHGNICGQASHKNTGLTFDKAEGEGCRAHFDSDISPGAFFSKISNEETIANQCPP